jgi:hypothetical protein
MRMRESGRQQPPSDVVYEVSSEPVGFRMRGLGHVALTADRQSSWRWAVICFAALCLVLTLTSRTFPLSAAGPDGPASVSSFSPKAKIQHMDKDAVRWLAPPVIWQPLGPLAHDFCFLSNQTPAYSHQIFVPLSNRPPPVARNFC